MSQEKILKTSQAFTMLTQCAADVFDCREEGEKGGFVHPDFSDDEAISSLCALYMLNQNYDKKYSPVLMSRIMEIYCRPRIFQDFRYFHSALDALSEYSDTF
jgi:hypothetical protein